MKRTLSNIIFIYVTFILLSYSFVITIQCQADEFECDYTCCPNGTECKQDGYSFKECILIKNTGPLLIIPVLISIISIIIPLF